MGSTLLGIIVPGLVFAISFVMTEFLFRHFSKKRDREERSDR